MSTQLVVQLLIAQALTLFLVTILLTVAASMVAVVGYRQWLRETGGISSLSGPVAQLFKRKRRPDGKYDLIPYDEDEGDEGGDPLEEAAKAEDELASFETDYMDGVRSSNYRMRD